MNELPPSSRDATAEGIEAWVLSQAPLLEIVDAAVAALGLGEPRLQVGPRFYPREVEQPAHLRRGAVWFLGNPPTNVGFRVELYGPRLRIHAWGHRRNVAVNSNEVNPPALAADLWTVLQIAGLCPDQLPMVEDGLGNAWAPCGPGCDLHVVRPGQVQCSCVTQGTGR